MIRLIGTTEKDGHIQLYYAYTKSGKNFFKSVTSSDGFEFNGATKYVIVTDPKGREEAKYEFKNFNIAPQGEKFYAAFKANTKAKDLTFAVSDQLLRWKKIAKEDSIKEFGALVPDYKYKHRFVLYTGEKDIKVAYSSQLESWKTVTKPVLESRPGFFDEGDLQVAKVFKHADQLLVIYYAKAKHGYYVGAAYFDPKNPEHLLWRSDKPLWEQPKLQHADPLEPLSVELTKEYIILYWTVNGTNMYAVTCPLPGKSLRDKDVEILLKKPHQNPILKPRPTHVWESRAVFNSAALYEDGKVHFLYRALGDSDLSVIGYATSKDGLHIDERSEEPIYLPREPFETPGGHRFKSFADHFASGGGYGGIEDPRVTKIDDTVFMTYVAFDGWSPPRAALTSIPLEDFLAKNWGKWKTPKLISPPGMVNKSAVIFPEKINGKYMVIHRVYPNILIDVLDDLDFDDKFLTGHHFIPPRKTHWDSKKIGAGAPPILTKDGWLLIYQSVGYQDSGRYKIGAMVLDKDDPTKVLYRTNNPIVSPDMPYDNEGFKAGVVYPCGAVIKDDKLFVYYGGADTIVAAATADVDDFLDKMKNHKEPKMKKVKGPVFNSI
jgi:beta-1,2-mannobiose phosphorylase / 1,2-beta-oligomannan phosphorylase